VNEYESIRRVVYGDDERATFVPVCSICGRFVRADDSIQMNDEIGIMRVPNATCSKCGRTEMLFEGFI
jgi:hypothetical protein